uniref:MAP6 domain containing 1 n=1 Tax=Accipiter nisus TaxID=211598 RepID=A0A8B9RXG0_9AVES
MAWPCISRVCCLARFWSQLDKSDLSVPLTIHNYSDIEEQEDGAPQRGGPPPRGSARPPTQYRRDFRAWPLPRRDAFPWVSASSGGGGRDGAAPQPAPGRAACALPGGGGRPAADAYKNDEVTLTLLMPSSPCDQYDRSQTLIFWNEQPGAGMHLNLAPLLIDIHHGRRGAFSSYKAAVEYCTSFALLPRVPQ